MLRGIWVGETTGETKRPPVREVVNARAKRGRDVRQVTTTRRSVVRVERIGPTVSHRTRHLRKNTGARSGHATNNSGVTSSDVVIGAAHLDDA